MLLEPEGAGATGRREFSLCARSPSLLLTCGQASQAAIAAGNERNNLKELKKNKPVQAYPAKFHQHMGLVCAGLFPVALQLVVAVYEVKTWLKQLVCTWIQSSSGWIRFLSCSFSVLEADLLSGGFASKSPVSAGSIEHRSGCWALLTAAGGQLWHSRGGLSLRAVSWQQDLPAQLVFLPS